MLRNTIAMQLVHRVKTHWHGRAYTILVPNFDALSDGVASTAKIGQSEPRCLKDRHSNVWLLDRADPAAGSSRV